MHEVNTPENTIYQWVTQWVNALSLVVVFGAISTAHFTAALFKSDLDFSFYWLLGSTVWVIYTLDHLLDGRKREPEELSFRHRLHADWRVPLTIIVISVIIFNALVVTLYTRESVVRSGAVLSAFVVLYFLLVAHSRLRHITGLKEIGVAAGAVSGMVILPALEGSTTLDMAFFVYVTAFFFLNLCNLTIFSMSDLLADSKSGFRSLATDLGRDKTKQLAYNLLGLCFLMFGVWTFLVQHPIKMVVAIIFLSMMHTLGFLLIQYGQESAEEKVRFWGDFIYVLPTPIWWLLT
jgi:4-hydroxybenzoate polyprenyltransferase